MASQKPSNLVWVKRLMAECEWARRRWVAIFPGIRTWPDPDVTRLSGRFEPILPEYKNQCAPRSFPTNLTAGRDHDRSDEGTGRGNRMSRRTGGPVMGWSIGYDETWKRDIGYGVPAICDHPDCNVLINRGLAHVCGGEPHGGEWGCGLFFCGNHRCMRHQRCERCSKSRKPFLAKPDCREWIEWKLSDASWQQWREENPGELAALQTALEASSPYVHVPAATECSAVFGRDCTFCRNATTGCVFCVRCGRKKLVICGQEVKQ